MTLAQATLTYSEAVKQQRLGDGSTGTLDQADTLFSGTLRLMAVDELSPLEAAVLQVFRSLYADSGFPDPAEIGVRGRKNTGAGRYVELDSDAVVREDGYLDMRGRFVEMEGLAHGLMAVVDVSDQRLGTLEMATYGDVPWDGEERAWSIR